VTDARFAHESCLDVSTAARRSRRRSTSIAKKTVGSSSSESQYRALIEPRQSLHWKADPHLLQAASMHGVLRRKQGYSVPLMLEEARILNAVVSDHARRNLLTVEISFLIPDLVEVADRTHYSAQQAVRGYLESPE
jgi:hypothetical protein